MLQRTVLVRMLQRKQTQQRTRRNNIGRRSTRVRVTCRTFPLWLERQSSSLLSFVRSSYQFSSVFAYLRLWQWKKICFSKLFCYIILATSQKNRVRKLINLDIKKEIISKQESGKSVGDLSAEYGMANGMANFHCFTVHFDSLSFVHTDSCTFSYKYVSVF